MGSCIFISSDNKKICANQAGHKQLINYQLNEAINKVFEDRDKMFEQRDKMLEQRDLRLAEQKREFDENLRLQRQEMLESRKELRQEILASRRWLMGTMLTIGLSLAAYLTTLFKMIH